MFWFFFFFLIPPRKLLAGLHLCQRHSGNGAERYVENDNNEQVLLARWRPSALPSPKVFLMESWGKSPKPCCWMGWQCPNSPPAGFLRAGAERDGISVGTNTLKPQPCNKRFPVKSHLLAFICRLESFWHCFIHTDRERHRFAFFYFFFFTLDQETAAARSS